MRTNDFHTFVANRISTIQEVSEPWQWRHVHSKDNPVDDALRGLKVTSFLQTSRWWESPTFLWKQPNTILDVSLNPDDPEMRGEATSNVINVCDSVKPTDQLIGYFSDWRKLKRIAAWFLRLKAVLLEKARWRKWLRGLWVWFIVQSRSKTLMVDDRSEAEAVVISYWRGDCCIVL